MSVCSSKYVCVDADIGNQLSVPSSCHTSVVWNWSKSYQRTAGALKSLEIENRLVTGKNSSLRWSGKEMIGRTSGGEGREEKKRPVD